jgi:hypothetical protein
MGKFKELQEELKMVLSGRGAQLLDSFLPLVIFLVLNSLAGLNYAVWGALGTAGLFALVRIIRRESLVYALGGLGGVLLSTVLVQLSGSGTGFFLPGLISGAVTVVVCVVSVAVNRPIVALTSFIARRWPMGWYWHPKVLPAYNEVTILWAVAFGARLFLEFWLYQRDASSALGTTRLILGWPYTILLLIVSYVYGLWRLNHLKGPSVEEYKAGADPPWEGQKRGF